MEVMLTSSYFFSVSFFGKITKFSNFMLVWKLLMIPAIWRMHEINSTFKSDILYLVGLFYSSPLCLFVHLPVNLRYD